MKAVHFLYQILTDYFGLNQKGWLMAANIGSVLAVWLADLTGAIKAEAIDSASYFLLLMVLVFLDWLTAVALAARYQKVETRKAFKLVTKMLTYGIIFVLARWIARVEPEALQWIPNGVITGLSLFTFASVLKNGSLLGLLPAPLASMLWRHVDAYKNQLVGSNPPPPENEQPAEQPIDDGERKQY